MAGPGLLATLNAHGITMLIAGIILGWLGSNLLQGYRSGDGETGAGIREMIESSRQQQQVRNATDPAPGLKPEPQTTNYDFFTVLPEIEVVVTEDEPPPPAPKKAAADSAGVGAGEQKQAEEKPAAAASSYMLQAGSFNSNADAERQKAGLALMGLSSSIQKVSIQGRGDFYRVRLGPFSDHTQMATVDEQLQQQGIKALRLKVSRAGQ